MEHLAPVTARERVRPHAPSAPSHPGHGQGPGWAPPAYEVISLCCEITAYAPDDEPLF